MKHKTVFWIGALTIAIVTAYIVQTHLKGSSSSDVPNPNPMEKTHAPFLNKRILWVNSYHKGYVWSDSEYEGAKRTLKNTGIILQQLFMDTKRHDNAEWGYSIANTLKQEIEKFQPDIIIAADDPAQKYLIVPHFKNSPIPVVFCGVNWNATEYGYPTQNITGIIEVELIENLLGYLREHAKGNRVAYVAGNDLSERKLISEYNSRFMDGKMLFFLADDNTFASYCIAFRKAQERADITILGGNGSITDWDDKTATTYFLENTTKPTGTANPWMKKYALIAYSRVAEEQGEWAAKTALQILSGTSPQDIPISKNKIGQLFINLDISDRMNVIFSPALLKNAKLIRQDDSEIDTF